MGQAAFQQHILPAFVTRFRWSGATDASKSVFYRAFDSLLQNLAIVERIKALAQRKGCLPGQLALAWVHAQVMPCHLRVTSPKHFVARNLGTNLDEVESMPCHPCRGLQSMQMHQFA